VLYPIGVASELTMAWLALPYLRATGKWSIVMPNAYNFAFSYYAACVLAMITYIPGEGGFARGSLGALNRAARLLGERRPPTSTDGPLSLLCCRHAAARLVPHNPA
jgi:hypothetical protein